MADPIIPPDPFSNNAIKQAIQGVDNLPAEQVQLGVDATATDIGIEAEGRKDLGRGWFTGFDAQWWKTQGWKAAGLIGWQKK